MAEYGQKPTSTPGNGWARNTGSAKFGKPGKYPLEIPHPLPNPRAFGVSAGNLPAAPGNLALGRDIRQGNFAGGARWRLASRFDG